MLAKSTAAVLTATVLLAGCASAPTVTDAKADQATTRQAGDLVTAMGNFVGESGHVSSGSATILRRDGVWIVRLEDDFVLDNGPDPKVALGNDGFKSETILGKLKALKGGQEYALPANLDIGDYTQVYVWCERFSVPLARADLKVN